MKRKRPTSDAPTGGATPDQLHFTNELPSDLVKMDMLERARLAVRGEQEDIGHEDLWVVPDYQLIRAIGRGAFGTVWVAKNHHDGQHCAIKVFPKGNGTELAGIQEFKRRCGCSNHLVTIGHIGRCVGENLTYYYVMPLADNANSSSSVKTANEYEPLTLRRHVHRIGRLPAKDAARIGVGLLSGLEQLHQQGGLHRDVKPENILRFDGQWKLCDPGLACNSEFAKGDAGTTGYSPPEGTLDTTADLFGLAVTLRFAVLGFRANGMVNQSGSNLKSGDREFDGALDRACAENPSDRYQSASEMKAALNAFCEDANTQSRFHMWYLLAVLLCLVVGAGLIMKSVNAPPRSNSAISLDVADSNETRILDVHVNVWQRTADYLVPMGRLEACSKFQQFDLVRLAIKLNKIDNTYVVSLAPNGTWQLLFSDTAGARSTTNYEDRSTGTILIDCPRDSSSCYEIHEGTGIQGFIVVVAATPLDWQIRDDQSLGIPHEEQWGHQEMNENLVWRFSNNGHVAVPMSSERARITKLAKTPLWMKKVVDEFSSRPSVEDVYAVFFPVRASTKVE